MKITLSDENSKRLLIGMKAAERRCEDYKDMLDIYVGADQRPLLNLSAETRILLEILTDLRENGLNIEGLGQ
jgi:hypothetical protein